MLVVVLISLLLIIISPAVMLFTFNCDAPLPICDAIYVLIAFCVGTIASLFAVNVPSVLNSLITAPVDPRPSSPRLSSCNPLRLNASAFSVATPVDCSTENNSPTRKFPD